MIIFVDPNRQLKYLRMVHLFGSCVFEHTITDHDLVFVHCDADRSLQCVSQYPFVSNTLPTPAGAGH
jgi:hypothetical protein